MKGKRITVKLGSACNLHCKHCHVAEVAYKFNPDVIAFLRKEGPERITFCGGEPTLYMDVIKKIVEALPESMQYKLVTNGTTLTYDLADYFNKHKFRVIISYDGETSSRDRSLMQAWDEYAVINQGGVSTLFSPENADILRFSNQLELLRQRYMPRAVGASIWVNFPHQTEVNHNDSVSRDLAVRYCQVMAVALEGDFLRLKHGQKHNLSALGMAFHKWLETSSGRGVKCCNDDVLNVTLDGRFLLCPYGTEFVGDIYNGVDWDAVESHIPERCKSCPLWDVCRNTCIANITTNECYISRVMYRHILKLMGKYRVSYEDLEDTFRIKGGGILCW